MDRVWLVSEFYYPVVVTTGYYVRDCRKKNKTL